NSTNSIQKIGINKLGTLLSSQTTDTFEYFSNNYLNSNEFFCYHFFAAMFLAYFIHFHFANPVILPKFTWWSESAQQNMKQFFISATCA
ncbi:hypothetical protein PV761_15215, partial [Arthrobacter sp. CC3]|uniref:hypothetical protein n=1 Tax=Arthrobacter sp. CC3 TaxID=3029185 RepID=UPI003263EE7A